jgi:hypothetical protein
MSDGRLTIRFTDEELAGVETHAKVMHLTKTEVVRLAVQGLFNSTRTADKLDRSIEGLRQDLKTEIDSQMTQFSTQQKRTALLMLRVLQAPPEAEAAIDKIFGV